jgi:hypothetical protein
MPCRYCSVVNKIAYWGPRRPAAWKRPLLFIISLLILVFPPAILWFAHIGPSPTGMFGLALIYFLFAFIFVVGGFGLLIAVRACDACVARFSGDI